MADEGGGGTGGASRILANAVIVWGRIAITTIATLLTTRFVLEALGVEAFGVLFATVAIPLFLSFLTGAMQVNTQRALAMATDLPGVRQRIFNGTLGLHLGVALVLLVIGGFAGGWLLRTVMVVPEPLLAPAETVLRVSIAAAALGAFLAPYEAFRQADERFAMFAIIDVVRALALMGASLWLLSYDGERIIAYGWAMALTAGGAAVVGALLTAKGHPELRIRPDLLVDTEIFRTQMRLFGWTLVGSASAVARNQGMAIVVNIFFGPVGSAAYTVGNQLLSAIRQLSGAISGVLAPRIFRIEAQGQRDRMITNSLASCRLSSLVALTLGLPLAAEIDTVLALWLETPPNLAGTVAILLIVGFLIDQLSIPIGVAHLAVGAIARYQLIVGSLAIASLPIAVTMGALGAGLPTILSCLAMMTLVVAWIRVELLEPHAPSAVRRWISAVVLPVIATGTAPLIGALAIIGLLPQGEGRLLLTFAVFSVLLLWSAYRFGLMSAERLALNALLARWRACL